MKSVKSSMSANSECYSEETIKSLYLTMREERGRDAGHVGEFTVGAAEAPSFQWHVC